MTAPLPIVQVRIHDLARMDPANPNRMDPEEEAKLGASIGRDGFTQPILVRAVAGGHEVIDGEHRVDAAAAAGLLEVPAVVLHCSAEQARALRVSMNRLRGELDLTAVAREFKALAEAGWDVPSLAALGFTDQEVTALLDAGLHPDPEAMPDAIDAAPPPAIPPTSWTLEIEFDRREDLNRAKRRLRRLAGKGAPLSAGLLRALAEDT